MRWSKFCLFESYNDNVIIANTYNGAWTKLNKKLFDFIDSACNRELSTKYFIDEFVKEDQDYIKKIYEKFCKAGFIDNGQQITSKNMVLFEVTRRCNLYCKHCCVDASQNITDLSLKNIKKILAELSKYNLNILTLTGGEPLLREDIFTILEYIRGYY